MKLLVDLPLDKPPYPPEASLTPSDIIEAAVALWIDQYTDDDRLDANTVEQVVEYVASRMGLSVGKSEIQETLYHYVNDIIMETYEAVDVSLGRVVNALAKRPLLNYVCVSFPTLVIEVHHLDE